MPRNPNAKEMVPTANLRALFERSGDTPGEIAYRLGWTRRNYRGDKDGKHVDSDRVERMLGLKEITNKGAKYRMKQVNVDVAEQLVRAMGFDPRDAGF